MVATAARALFERDGDQLVPSELARGPWRPDALHGAAVAALLVSALDAPGRTLTRITFDLLASVPLAPLSIDAGAWEGGRRVTRKTVELRSAGVVVARAQGLSVRQTDLELPESRSEAPNPFAGVPVPDLSEPYRAAAANIGWESFDSAAVSLAWLRGAARPEHTVCQYVRLLVPVVDEEPTPAVARAVVAADFGSNHVYGQLPFDRWSFMNVDLTVNLARRPVGEWIGIMGTSITHRSGAGTTVSGLFDESGWLGQSTQSLLVEERPRVSEQ